MGTKHRLTQDDIPDKPIPYLHSCENVKNFYVVVNEEGSQQNSACVTYFTHLRYVISKSSLSGFNSTEKSKLTIQ
jgi:hypothetical protein